MIQNRQQETHSCLFPAPFLHSSTVQQPLPRDWWCHSELGLPESVNTIKANPEQTFLQGTWSRQLLIGNHFQAFLDGVKETFKTDYHNIKLQYGFSAAALTGVLTGHVFSLPSLLCILLQSRHFGELQLTQPVAHGKGEQNPTNNHSCHLILSLLPA